MGSCEESETEKLIPWARHLSGHLGVPIPCQGALSTLLSPQVLSPSPSSSQEVVMAPSSRQSKVTGPSLIPAHLLYVASYATPFNHLRVQPHFPAETLAFHQLPNLRVKAVTVPLANPFLITRRDTGFKNDPLFCSSHTSPPSPFLMD